MSGASIPYSGLPRDAWIELPGLLPQASSHPMSSAIIVPSDLSS